MVRVQDVSLDNKHIENIDAPNAAKLFNEFLQSQTCQQAYSTFLNLCQVINLHYPPSPSSSTSFSSDHLSFYPQLKSFLSDWKAQSVWSKLDKRFYGKEYFVNPRLNKATGQRIGADAKVLIIGAGPCGLRTAIEMACLGTKVVVLEKRDNFSRNNVLHLWPFIITDLKALGAKKLYGRFCAGAIDHISIRQLQLILLKLALMLGVEIVFNVSFEKLLPPSNLSEETDECDKGWTAELNPANHPVSKYEFDVVVGADGKRNTLQGFKRKEFRGKLAIGLTVNFINRNTTAEAKVEEISGVAYIFNQQFFKGLHKETGIDLENIVYYKGETHYFVMTAKKHSLISKGVLKQDYDDTSKLLSYHNVDRDAMMSYAKEAAGFSTHHQLPTMDFAINHFGEPDVALFDFTCMYAAENAALFRESKGHKLLSCLVGDSLLEPFWPMGTGCARGFLAAFDTTWMVRQWSLKRTELLSDNNVELEVLAERESIYRLLHQTTPQNTMKNLAAYTIDPNSRYVNLNSKVVSKQQVAIYYLSDRPFPNPVSSPNGGLLKPDDNRLNGKLKKGSLTRKVSMVRSSKLLTWTRRMTDGYDGVHVVDMTSSWKSGLAICAIIHRYRPDLINLSDLSLSTVEKNNQLAFDVAESQLGISPIMTGKEMAERESVDKLLMVTYISQFYELFKHETPTGSPPVRRTSESKNESDEAPKSPTGISLTSPVGLLTRFTQHLRRRSYSVQGKQEESDLKKKKISIYRKKDETILPEQSLSVVHENGEQLENTNLDNKTVQIGKTTVKLREKKMSELPNKPNVNQRVSDRISALSNQLISQWEQNAPQSSPNQVKRQVDVSDFPIPPSASDKCYFCQRRVYIVERLSAEGHFFHRQCFVCSYCGLTLRRGAYEYVKESGKFFCRAACIAAAESKSTSRPFVSKSSHNVETDSGITNSALGYPTPERIELENARFSTLTSQPEEVAEEAQARHNCTLTRDLKGIQLDDDDDDDDDDDELMSDSSDDEIMWEEVLREANNGKLKKYDDSMIGSSAEELPDSQSSTLVRRKTINNLNYCKSFTELNGTLKNQNEESDNKQINQTVNSPDVHHRNANAETKSIQTETVAFHHYANPSYELVETAKENEKLITKKPVPLPRRKSKSISDQPTPIDIKNVDLSKKSTSDEIPSECVFLSVSQADLLKHNEEKQLEPTQCHKYYIPKNELSLLLKYTSNAVQSEKSSFPNFKEHRSILNVISNWLLGEKDRIETEKKVIPTKVKVNEEVEDASDISVADISSDEEDSLEVKQSPTSNISSSEKIKDDGVDVPDNAITNQMIKEAVLSSSSSPSVDSHRRSLSSVSSASHSGDAAFADVNKSPPTNLDDNVRSNQSNTNDAKQPKTVFSILRKSSIPSNTKPVEILEYTDVLRDLPKLKSESAAGKERGRYDTLDRVQDYLHKTPISLTQQSTNKLERKLSDRSSSSTISLSSVSSDPAYENYDISDFLNENETLDEEIFDKHESISSNSAKVEEFLKTDRTSSNEQPSRPRSRHLTTDEAVLNTSLNSQNDTSIWSDAKEAIRQRSVENSLNESFISEYKPPKDETQKFQTSPARRLSYESIERRMKFRLRARNRWLREESNSNKSVSRSSSVTSNNSSSVIDDVGPDNKPTSPSSNSAADSTSSNMLIIELTPSIDKPLTPTAPPKSRQQSYDGDSDYFFTPTAKPPASPPASNFFEKTLDLDATGEFVSAPSTPLERTDAADQIDKTENNPLPSLPKVPYLEAISPTGSANNTLNKKKRDIENEVNKVEERVKQVIMKRLSNEPVPHKTSSRDESFDTSISGYSPVPSRRKSSLKKRNNRKPVSPAKDKTDSKLAANREKTVRIVEPNHKTPEEILKKDRNQKKHRKKENSDKKSTRIKIEDIDKEQNKWSSRLFSNRKKEKKKLEKLKPGDVTTLERKYPNQSDRDRAIIMGERFRINASSVASPVSFVDAYESPAEEELSKYWAKRRRRSQMSGLTPEQIDEKITRRVQIAARRQAKLEAQKRLRRAQVIQRQLEEIEVKQKDLEERGVELEQILRAENEQREESRYMQEWFKLVQEKNALLRYENELMIHQRELQLEDAQSRLQQELRERMALDDNKKTKDELDEEKEILQKMLDVVEQRDELVALLEEQRLKEKDEFVDAETLLLNKFHNFPNDSNPSPR